LHCKEYIPNAVPKNRPDVFDAANDTGRGQMPFVRRNIGEQIQADGEVEVSGIEIDQMIARFGVIDAQFSAKISCVNPPNGHHLVYSIPLTSTSPSA